jgi:hypothetical protein
MEEVKDKQKCLTIRGQLKLVVAIVLVSWLFVLNNLAYYAGFTNSYLLVFLAVTLWFPLTGISIVCLIYQFHKFNSYGACNPRSHLFQKCTLYVSAAILLGSFLFHESWWIRQTEGLRDRMIRMNFEKELPLIREWFTQIGDGSGSYPQRVLIEDCPPAIRKLRPRYVSLGTAINNADSYVEILGISWGGGPIGGWGIAIGPVSMDIPESSETEYILPFAPGAYVFHAVL